MNPPPKSPFLTFRLFDFQAYDYNENQSSSLLEEGNGDSGEEEIPPPPSSEEEKKEKKTANFRIEMFGVNEKGETCALFVDDVNPFFFVKVGDNWTYSDVNAFMRDLKKRLKFEESGLIDAKLVEYNKLYGFTGGKNFKFVQLFFKNMSCFNKTRNFWYSYNPNRQSGGSDDRKFKPLIFQNVALELYESKIPPLLRYFHIQNMSPSGWVKVYINKAKKMQQKTTTCDYEFYCSQKYVVPLPQKETAVPYKICSFDIEASSSHGDFPVPIKTYKRLATQMVDLFLLRSTEMADPKKAKMLFEVIIKKAFNLSKSSLVNSIDLVYPKQVPAKQIIEKLIQELCVKPVELVRSQECEGSNIMTISSAFEKIAEDAKALVSKTADGAEGGEDSDDDEAEGAGDVEIGGGGYRPFYKKQEPVTAEKMATILDVLMQKTYTREAKIQLVNEALTNTFPPLEGDRVTFIGSTFMKYGQTEPYLNHCLVVGSCDPVEGAVIETVHDERELLIQWAELIQNENPDIIIGYNIFGFDYEFMFRRSQETHCVYDFLKLSRKLNDVCVKKGRDGEQNLEQTKNRLASGDYDLHYPNIAGRLQIDLLFYFRRDFNLSSYKLDDVAGNFIRDDVKHIYFTNEDELGTEEKTREFETKKTHLCSKNLAGLHIGDFIHIEITGFTSDYYKKGKKFQVLDIRYNQEIDGTKYNVITIEGNYSDLDPKKQYIKWGMAKDDVSPQDIFRLTNGSAQDRAIVAKYCIQDCNLVQHLMNKTDVLTGYIEMARICNVPIRFLVFRGQGIKLTSYVAKTCRDKNTLMPDLEQNNNDDGYEGAIVLPPKCNMYMDNPVACVDYSSLYPSIAKGWNLSPNSKVWTKEYDLEGKLITETGEKDPKTGQYIYDNLPNYKYIEVEFDTFKTMQKPPSKPGGKMGKKEKIKSGKKVVRWAQFPNGQEGIIPAIIGDLLKARSDTRKMAEEEKDPFMANILDKRQLGYKVTANSLYGQMGSSVSTFFEKDVAASITAIGRMMITYAKKMIEQIYGDSIYETKNNGTVRTRGAYVYGDTDSVFFTFNLEEPESGEPIRGKRALEITIEIAQEAANLCSLFLPPPMKLAYEKTLMSFILLSKKRYVGMLYETNPNKGKLKFMGLSLKRRDCCDYLKDVYGGVLTVLMQEPNNIPKAIEFLNVSLKNLVDGNVSMDKLAITKSLRSDYKNPDQIAHKVLAERIGEREPGNKPKPGDRIKYVFIVNPDKKALLGERIETFEYILAKKLQIDYNYYITNQLMKPLQQLFGLAVEKIWESMGKKSLISGFNKEMDAIYKTVDGDLEIYNKKREKYTSAKVKEILFDPFLMQIYQKQNGIQTISSMFSRIRG